jgi:hypothetical protein
MTREKASVPVENQIFRKASLESIASPEQLNEYIKVSTPSIWIVLVSLFVLLAAVFAWGYLGSLPTTINAPGVVLDGQIICYLHPEDALEVKAGQTAIIYSREDLKLNGEVAAVGDLPLSATEIAAELNSDYLAQRLIDDSFAVKITILLADPALADHALLDVRIITDSVKPIDFLTN